MFPSNLQLTQAQIERKIKVIQKYFCTQTVMPHNFIKKISIAKPYSKFLTYKPVSKKSFAPIYKLVNQVEIEETIAKVCSFDMQLDPGIFEFFQKAAFLPKSKEIEPCIEYTFHSGMRLFIRLIYLIPSHILRCISNPQEKPYILSNFAKLMCYFTRNEEFINIDFFEIYALIIGQFSLNWRNVFVGNSTELKSLLLGILMCLIPLIPIELKITSLDPKISFPFIVDQLTVTVDYLPIIFGSNIFFQQFQSILSGFIAFISFADASQSEKVMKILNKIFLFIPKSGYAQKDIIQTGSVCLNICCECSKIAHKKADVEQFQTILDFISWVLKAYIENISVSSEYHHIQVDFDQPLSEFSLEAYSKRNLSLKNFKPIVITSTISHYDEKITGIISRSKNPEKLVEKIISFLFICKPNTTPQEFRTLLAFVFSVLNKVDGKPLEAVMTKKWDTLFFDSIFLSDSDQPINDHLQNMILSAYYKCFISRPNTRCEILNCVSDFLTKNSNNFVPFLPFLNSLLEANDKAEFGAALMNSTLMKNIIDTASEHKLLFDFLRTTVFVFPRDLFASQLVCKFFVEKINIKEYQSSFIDCIERGLCQCGSSTLTSATTTQLLCHITIALRFLAENNDPISLNIIESLASSIPSFHPLNLDCLIKAEILEAVSDICISSKEHNIFTVCLKVFSSTWRSTWEMQEKFNKPKFFVNSNLIKAVNDNAFEFDLTDDLLDFATNVLGFFGNSVAISILLKWSIDKPNEQKILEFLRKKARESMSNVFALQKAKIVDHIFSRLIVPELVPLLLEMLFIVATYGFSNSIFYSAIKILKSPSFQFPHVLIAVFQRLLRQSSSNEYQSFFFLDGHNSGLFGPTISCSLESLAIVTKIKPLNLPTHDEMPLFALRSEQKELLLLGFEGKKLCCRFNSETLGSFNMEFFGGIWYNIAVVISTRNVSLYVNGKLDGANFTIPPFFNGATGVWIGCSTKKPHSMCYSGAIGPVLFLNDFNPDFDYTTMNYLTLPRNIREHVVLNYNPRNVNESKVTRVSRELANSDLQGIAIQAYKTISTILPTINSIDNILPLFLRLQGCEKCQNNRVYCPECGCLNIADGQEYINNILLLISAIFVNTNSLHINLATSSFSSLLASILMKVQPIFFNENFLKSITTLFESMKPLGMTPKMVITIWLNFDLVKRFDISLQKLYFTIYLPQAFEIGREAFLTFVSYDFFIYRLIKFFGDGSDLSYLAWKFSFTLLKQNLSFNTSSSLIAIPLNIEWESVTFLILSFIQDLVVENNETMIQVLQRCNCLLPFVILLSKNSAAIQLQAITAMDHFYDQKDIFETAILQSIVLINKEQSLNQIIITITDNLVSGKSRYFPLILHIMSDLNEELFKIYWNKILLSFSTNVDILMSDDEIWDYWLLRFIHMANKYPNLSLDATPLFGIHVRSEFEYGHLNALSNLQAILSADSIEFCTDNTSLLKNILVFLMQDLLTHLKICETCIQQLFEVCFRVIFYHPKQVTEKVPVDPPEFLTSLPFLNNLFCWYNSDATIQYSFGITVDENGKWKDFSMAELMLSFLKHFQYFNVKITEELTLHSLVVYSFLLIHLRKFGFNQFEENVKGISSLFCNADYEVVVQCASILATLSNFAFSPTIENIELSRLQQLEGMLAEQHPILSAEMRKNRHNFTSYIVTTLQSRLQVLSKPKNRRRKKPMNEVELFLFSLSTNSFSALNSVYTNFNQRQKTADEGSKTSAAKLLSVFIKELQIGSGPWSEPYQSLHFKSAKRTSPTGCRAMMRINYTFNDHKTAQTMKQRLKTIPKFLSTSQVGFRTNVNLTTLRFVYEGELSVSSEAIVFECSRKKFDLPLRKVAFIFTRTQGREDTAVEIYLNSNKSYIFVFAVEERAKFLQAVEQQHVTADPQISGRKFNFFAELRNVSNGIYQKTRSAELLQKLQITEKWQKRIISTFSYLYYLNILAGRSFNDISQYPVYPWVIADYDSDSINLNNPEIFRDLSKPLGAINEKQIETLREAYKEDAGSPLGSCLYRSHYSSPHLVCGFLIRMEPFTTLHVSIQGDQFDDSTRIFSSVGKIWSDIVTGTRDFRELVPEFYSNYHFLVNENGFDLNADHNNVELPKWANGSPAEFVKINRAALESEFVSMHINEWIDLIFGVNRSNPEVDNVYMPFSYTENIPENPEFAPMMQESALNFGVCAQKIFDAPHPQRLPRSLLTKPLVIYPPDSGCVLRIRKRTVVNTDLTVTWSNGVKSKFASTMAPSIVEVSKLFKLIFFAGELDSIVSCFTIEGTVKSLNISPSNIHSISVVAGRTLLTGSSDGALRRWALPSMKYVSMSSFHCYPVVSCTGNGDLNLIVSIDSHFNMIYETLNDAVFIRNVKLEKFGKIPFIILFKSGTVAVIMKNSEKSIIIIFDIQGNEVKRREFCSPIIEYDKYVREDAGEYLVAAIDESKIVVLSIPDLNTEKEINGNFQKGRFCVIKNKQTIIAMAADHNIVSIDLY